MKPTLVFQAPIATRSGYGDHARDLLHSLYKLDKFDIKIISTRWGNTPMDALNYDNEFHKWAVDNIIPQITEKPDIYIQVTVPNEFQPLGFYNIGITAAIETTHCALDWIHGCNRMDLIIVPSEHSKKSLVDTVYNEQDKQSGQLVAQHRIQKPVEILFEGFDEADFGTKTFEHITELDSIKEEFAFLFVGHWLRGDLGEDRKNVGMMIKTFAMAFKNEKVKPALVLKTSSAGFSVIDRETTIKKIRDAGFSTVIEERIITTNADTLSVRIVKTKNEPTVNHGHVHEQEIQEEKWVEYTGKVVCFEIPDTHLFYYKKDVLEPPCWTGNSSRSG